MHTSTVWDSHKVSKLTVFNVIAHIQDWENKIK